MRMIPKALLGAVLLGLGCRAPQPTPSPSPAPVRQKTELYPVGNLPAAAQEQATALSSALFVQGSLQQDRGDDAGARLSLEAALAAAPQLDGLKTQLGQVA
jgi:hypothetical protein